MKNVQISFGDEPFSEQMDGFRPNLHRNILGRRPRVGYILVTFTPYFQGHQTLKYVEISRLRTVQKLILSSSRKKILELLLKCSRTVQVYFKECYCKFPMSMDYHCKKFH